VSWRRLLAGGVILTALTGLVGVGLELWRFGRSEEAAVSRVEAHVHRQFESMVRNVTSVSARIAGDAGSVSALAAGTDGARALFDLVGAARRSSREPDHIAVTVYDSANIARAWAGAPSDIPDDRISGPETLFVVRSPLGLRLVHVQPLPSGEDGRPGTVATEHVLSPAPIVTAIAPAEYAIETPLAPALLRIDAPGERTRPGTAVLRGPSGEALAEAWVDPSVLRQARSRWRRHVVAAMLTVLGLTVLLLVGPQLDRRLIRGSPGTESDAHPDGGARHSRLTAHHLKATLAAMCLTAVGGFVLWLAFAEDKGGLPSTSATMLLGGATIAGIVALLAAPAARVRVALRRHRLSPRDRVMRLIFTQLLAGGAVAALILVFHRLLQAILSPAAVDVRHFSPHPASAPRLMLLTGIVFVHLAVLWGATFVLVSAAARWRIAAAALRVRSAMVALWVGPALAVGTIAHVRGWPIPAQSLVLSAAVCAIAALVGTRVATWYRRATVAARIFALFLAFLVPTLLLHPAMDFFAERATRELIARQYAVQAQNHVQTLLNRMEEARREVDAIDELPDLVSGDESPSPLPTPDAAFLIWKQTVLARERLTSAVELYDAAGGLVSRFALNVPEYTAATFQSSTGCKWDVFGEVAPFGAEERRMLHAERGICAPDENGIPVPRGAIILHVVFEYETLPFITSQNPYFEVFRAAEAPLEGTPGGSVEVAIYGWGLQPLYTSCRSAWPLTDALFDRIYRSRQPFWTEVTNGGVTHRVYFSNDRERIFAIGYPILTLFDHLVHLAELTTFSGVTFVLVLIGTAFFTWLARQRPRVGRALLREIRASFYRKLFLAFVLAAVIPVLTLALVIRAYFSNLLRADIEAEAARTASVAQRLIEEADEMLRRNPDALGRLSDDVMVWIEQVIHQDVNVFQGARLVATSERDLFASGVLPTRTPDDVYRAIVLQRLPSYVREDAIGNFTYVLAAAPVRAAGEEALLSVPLALRQREIERESDELDRGVHLAALFFVLLGAAMGLWMAERIADPVRRLTRATGRIAKGDFDARIAVKSVDELRRLVDAFNSMAEELKAQRSQLERTHRIEAWAEMARQVAHEIKNPLTPIQLSAEHLQRVHADRGEPLGPVLESCVASILGQVRLLRQISAEFSSFASSPTVRRARVDVPELVAEVMNPYITGLQGRIAIVNRVPGRLPAVWVDRTLVARALANIVENALHAMPGPGTLTIDAAADDGTVRLAVTDTGVGMDEEALDRVFEPYFSTKTTGTGLGLPIARRNIEASGGSIEVASARTVGTTVTVRLPVVGT
jgi:signal transduction histidine kinase